ncbi:MAG TPA: nucleotide-binding protein [Pyrinomonadaceae bacterium]|nr:nucleotide-binding protein [Pyrinomonadaceae bacterium]
MSERLLPKVFVGCSTDAYRIAQAIQTNLDPRNVAFLKIWPQNVFEPSHHTDQDLIKSAPTFDFAIFILSPDDDVKSHDVEQKAPRDNVIYELGLFMGVLDRDRVFLLRERNRDLKVPTDVIGVNPINYTPPPEGSDDWEAALGAPSNIIEQAIRRRGLRASAQEVVKTSEEQYQLAAQYFDRFLKDKYGVSTVRDSMTLTITDFEGSATMKRTCTGLKISGGITMGRIAEKVYIPTPTSKILRQPYFVRDPDFDKPVFLDLKRREEHLSEFDVVIGPPLSQFDRGLDYEYAIDIYKFCLMTREEISKAYQEADFRYEYISLKIAMPSDEAVVEVMFPEHYVAQTYPAVFIGESESRHESELKRAHPGFVKTERGARFTVNKPIVGFNYLIYWVSPTQTDFDKMQKRLV